MKKWIELKTEFSCAHFYKVNSWTSEENKSTFGLCFTEHGHGHDYTLYSLWNPEHQEAAQAKLTKLKELLDHQHLNFVIPEFKEKVPSTENLALFCMSHLTDQQRQPIKIRLYENPSLWVELSKT